MEMKMNKRKRKNQYVKTGKPSHKTHIVCKKCKKRVSCTSARQLYCKECRIIKRKQYNSDYIKQYRTTPIGKKVIKKILFRQQRKIHSELITETFTMAQWFKKLDDSKGICPMCNKFIGKDKLCIDHIYPTSKAEKGRIYTINDVQPLCRVCNTIKGNKC